MSFFTKIYLLLVSISLLVGGASAYFGGKLTEEALHQELTERGSYMVSTLSEAYTNSIANRDILPVSKGIHKMVEEQEDVEYVYITGFDGDVIVHTFTDGFPVELLTAWAGEPIENNIINMTDVTGELAFIDYRRTLIEGLPAYVHVGLSLAYAERNTAAVRQRILLTTLLITLIGIGVGTIFGRRFTTPLNRLSSLLMLHGKGESLQAKDVALESGGKELQALSRAFQTMLTERAESEAQLRLAGSVFDNTQEGIFITDHQGLILSSNTAFTEITGYSAEEAVGNTPKMLKSNRQDSLFYNNFWSVLRETGHWQGEIWNRRKNKEVFPVWQTVSAVKDRQGNTSNYISIFSDITDRKISEQRIAHLAYHDALTGLPNRLLFNERLEQALVRARRTRNGLALLFLDLDRFKDVNDSLGHPVGDELLKAISARLRDGLREEDTIARLGGDEFIILINGLSQNQNAGLVAQKILDTFASPLMVKGHEMQVRTSIGVSLYPNDGEDAAMLVKNADAALYRAKDEGRNNYQFYKLEMTTSAAERLAMENSLRRALENEEFQLHYQPQISLVDGRVLGAEALLRWHHPDLGMVSPAKFIPLAEEIGLIIPIGEWVLLTACNQLQNWQQAGIPIDCVSVNVSGIQVQRGNLVTTLKSVLNKTGLRPECLELEITESAIMDDAAHAINTLEELEKLGVKLAIDDFGTGYSSLSYLKQMPLHLLKIDQSFVRDVPGDDDDEAIIRAIISLGQSLRLRVIAEGVETVEQQKFLESQNCSEAQGYLYSRPLPADKLAEWIVCNLAA